MNRLVFVLALSPVILALPAASAAQPEPGLVRVFAGYDAAFLVTDLDGREVASLGGWRLARRLSPCSSFKVANALIGLDTGVIPGEDFVLRWDGVQRVIPAWNRDLDLREAVKVSCVWYFQELARRVGDERMQEYLRKFAYGNQDTSGGLTTFWLRSSLKVSALEQLVFLRRLMKDDLPVSRRAQRLVRELIVQERDSSDIFAGKTGTGHDPTLTTALHGWFVGYVVRDGRTYVFAANLQRGDNSTGRKAKDLVRKALVHLDLWGPRRRGGSGA